MSPAIYEPYQPPTTTFEPDNQVALLIDNTKQQESNKQKTKRPYHISSLIMTFFVFVTLISGFLCYSTSNKDTGLCSDYNKIFVFLLPIVYFAYWVECCLSRSQKFLWSDIDAAEYEHFVSQMKDAVPRIGTKVECYHYETHTKTYTYRDSEDKEITETKTWREKVVTFKETNYYQFLSWKDATFEGPDNGADLIRLDVEKMYTFDCIESERKFKEHRQNYIENCRKKDELFQSWPVFEIPRFRDQVLAKRKGMEQSCCVHVCWYWLWSLFLLSWPYRMWFGGLSQDQKIIVKKVITA